MDSNSYEEAFDDFEASHARYGEVQQRIWEFLSQFTGRAAVTEDQFEIADLETMNELRAERDRTFEEYRAKEKAIFERLSAAWHEPDMGNRFRVQRPRD